MSTPSSQSPIATSTPATARPSPLPSISSSNDQNTRPASILDAIQTIRPADFTTFHQKPCVRDSLLTGIGAGTAIAGLRFIILWQRPSASAPASAQTSALPTTPNTSLTSNLTSRSTPHPSQPAITAQTPSSPSPSPATPRTPSRRPIPARPSPITSLQNGTLSARTWRSMSWGIITFVVVSAGSYEFCQRKRALEKAAMARAAEIVARKREEKKVEAVRKREERERRRVEHEAEKGSWSRWGRWLGFGSSGDAARGSGGVKSDGGGGGSSSGGGDTIGKGK